MLGLADVDLVEVVIGLGRHLSSVGSRSRLSAPAGYWPAGQFRL
jgi:hypothetical protein